MTISVPPSTLSVDAVALDNFRLMLQNDPQQSLNWLEYHAQGMTPSVDNKGRVLDYDLVVIAKLLMGYNTMKVVVRK